MAVSIVGTKSTTDGDVLGVCSISTTDYRHRRVTAPHSHACFTSRTSAIVGIDSGYLSIPQDSRCDVYPPVAKVGKFT